MTPEVARLVKATRKIEGAFRVCYYMLTSGDHERIVEMRMCVWEANVTEAIRAVEEADKGDGDYRAMWEKFGTEMIGLSCDEPDVAHVLMDRMQEIQGEATGESKERGGHLPLLDREMRDREKWKSRAEKAEAQIKRDREDWEIEKRGHDRTFKGYGDAVARAEKAEARWTKLVEEREKIPRDIRARGWLYTKMTEIEGEES